MSSKLKAVLTACMMSLILCLLFSDTLYAEHGTRDRRILILYHEAGWAAPSNRDMYAGMRSYFDDHTKDRITLYTETMDMSLFQGPESQYRLVEFYRRKYKNQKIEVVIPVYDATLSFLLRNRDMFPNVPVVYMAPGGITAHNQKAFGLTGVSHELDIRGTINLALKIHPGLKYVALIAGTGEVDRHLASIAQKMLASYAGRLEIINLTGLTMNKTILMSARLPKDTVILFISFFQDGAGERFISVEAQEIISHTANAPLYTIYDTRIGHGCVGGSMIDLKLLGQKTAETVFRVLSGEQIEKIRPVVLKSSTAIFDWHEMMRWGISVRSLPEGSTVYY